MTNKRVRLFGGPRDGQLLEIPKETNVVTVSELVEPYETPSRDPAVSVQTRSGQYRQHEERPLCFHWQGWSS